MQLPSLACSPREIFFVKRTIVNCCYYYAIMVFYQVERTKNSKTEHKYVYYQGYFYCGTFEN